MVKAQGKFKTTSLSSMATTTTGVAMTCRCIVIAVFGEIKQHIYLYNLKFFYTDLLKF